VKKKYLYILIAVLLLGALALSACQSGPAEQPTEEMEEEEMEPTEEPAEEEVGFETTIYYRDVFRDYLPRPGDVAVEIQTQLKENLNIDAEVVVMESGEFIAESTAGNLDGIYLLGWTGDYPHPTNFLDFHFSKDNPQFGEPFPSIYEPLNEASQIEDPNDALGLYEEANNAIKENVPMVPIVHSSAAYAAKTSLEGINNPPFGAPIMRLIDPGKDTLVYMQNAEPISLYCADETDGESLSACQQVLEGLYRYNTEGKPEPALAKECTANDELTEWTCTLREGVMFHDGSMLDANDVVASMAAGLDASNPYHEGNTGAWEYYSYLWGGLMNQEADEGEPIEVPEGEGDKPYGEIPYEEPLSFSSQNGCEYGGKVREISAVDQFTVKFDLCQPHPAFIAQMAFNVFSVQPREYIAYTGGTGEILENPVGTGAYQLETWNRGDSIIFTRFEDYWGENAEAETLVFRWATESAARLLELQSGTVDYITNITEEDMAAVEEDPDLEVVPLPAPNILYVAMTNTFEPFDDLKVRKAIAMGLDRERIVENFYPEGSEVASHFTPCSIPGGCEGESWYDFDPERARELLREAGVFK